MVKILSKPSTDSKQRDLRSRQGMDYKPLWGAAVHQRANGQWGNGEDLVEAKHRRRRPDRHVLRAPKRGRRPRTPDAPDVPTNGQMLQTLRGRKSVRKLMHLTKTRLPPRPRVRMRICRHMLQGLPQGIAVRRHVY